MRTLLSQFPIGCKQSLPASLRNFYTFARRHHGKTSLIGRGKNPTRADDSATSQ